MANEETPILKGESPAMSFINLNRNRWKSPNRLRCCLFSISLIVIVGILLTTIFYSLNSFSQDPENRNNSQASSQLISIFNTTWPIKDQLNLFSREPLVNVSDIRKAIDSGFESLSQRESLETNLPKVDFDSPSFRHQLSMKTTERARDLAKFGFILETGTKELSKRLKNCSECTGGRFVGKLRLDGEKWLPEQVCTRAKPAACNKSPYRTPGGSCNNLQNPEVWGVAMQPFRRILAPEYADAAHLNKMKLWTQILAMRYPTANNTRPPLALVFHGVSTPRTSSVRNLPSPREVSLKIHRPLYVKDMDFTVMLAVWGQFIDHDMTATALSQGLNGEAIACCRSSIKHPECFPVYFGQDDPFFKEYNVTCMDFVRSAPAPSCSLGPREQLNQASSFIDGSVIYGNSKRTMDDLRTFKNGELKMLTTLSGEELLPISMDLNDGCNRKEQFKRGRYCFLTGDLRSNENLHLVSMHLIFARQHNLIARQLSSLNPNWNDEKTFQESRKIVGAQLQRITYNEFLPAILPPELMDDLNISLQSNGYFENYNGSVNPSIANNFAACVFRFGHSLLPGLFKLISKNSSSEEYVELHKMLFNPFGLYDADFLGKVMRGALNTSGERSDVYFNKEITKNLFTNDVAKGPCGLDLVSLNIQRGRDHGLPGYPNWRIPCGLKAIKSLRDLEGVFDIDSLKNIKSLYESVDDIDLFTGGLAEIPLNGSLLGPTFTCLLADQFLRLKIGDRYWFETQEKPQAFTPDQLQELRKTSLARIICDNSDISEAQPMVMKRVGGSNMRIPCEDIPSPIFAAWKE